MATTATTRATATTATELPEEARSWLARTLLLETLLEGLRRGGTVIAADRIWTVTPPARAHRQDPAAA